MVDGKPVTTGTVTNDTLVYTQTSSTTKAGGSIRTYVTDPERATVLIRVRFDSLDGKDHDVELAFDPQLYNDGNDDVGWTRGHALLAHDRHIASALVARPVADPHELAATRAATTHLLEHTYDALRPGNVVQQAHTPPDRPRRPARHDARARLRAGRARRRSRPRTAALDNGFDATSGRLQPGLARLPRAPVPDPGRGAAGRRRLRDEPARAQGPRGQGQPGRVRRQPEHALGLGPAHDRQGEPALGPVPPRLGARPLPDRHRAARGGRQGRRQPRARLPVRQPAARRRLVPAEHPGRRAAQVEGLQMDQQGLPIVLAWQLGRTDASDWSHVRKAADFIVEQGPKSEQERWENQEGYSPGTIAAEIAGLICAADIARKNGAAAPRGDATSARPTRGSATSSAGRRRATARTRPSRTTCALTKDREPEQGHEVRDRRQRPVEVDQRRVVDVSFLELVRLGVKRFDDPVILNTLQVVDRRLKAGEFWHRFSFDGYGEQRDGGPWRLFETTRARRSGARGRSSPASAASTSCSRAARRTRTCRRWRARATAGDAARSRSGTAAHRPAKPGFTAGEGTFSRDAFGLDARTARPARVVGRGRQLRSSARRSSRIAIRAARAKRYPSLPPRAGAGFSFAARRTNEPTTLGARRPWPAETSGSL